VRPRDVPRRVRHPGHQLYGAADGEGVGNAARGAGADLLLGAGRTDGGLSGIVAIVRPVRTSASDHHQHGGVCASDADHGAGGRRHRIDRPAIHHRHRARRGDSERRGADHRIQPESSARDLRARHLLRLLARLCRGRCDGRLDHPAARLARAALDWCDCPPHARRIRVHLPAGVARLPDPHQGRTRAHLAGGPPARRDAAGSGTSRVHDRGRSEARSGACFNPGERWERCCCGWCSCSTSRSFTRCKAGCRPF
jgi:hypothetical protein